MKVWQLIEELEQWDDDSEVVVVVNGTESVVTDVYRSGDDVIVETTPDHS